MLRGVEYNRMPGTMGEGASEQMGFNPVQQASHRHPRILKSQTSLVSPFARLLEESVRVILGIKSFLGLGLLVVGILRHLG